MMMKRSVKPQQMWVTNGIGHRVHRLFPDAERLSTVKVKTVCGRVMAAEKVVITRKALNGGCIICKRKARRFE